jgi:2-keto-4-pentenoate hydratase/2-oxohepta-3-ene-1,7-dioic acid hydratase in catechol pathway
MGPWIETDLDGDNLNIRLTLNGQVVQDSNTSDMVFSCKQLVSYVSQCMTLYPGSIIMTGTPEGVGMGRKPPLWLQDGDTMTVEIEGIGELTNPVKAER